MRKLRLRKIKKPGDQIHRAIIKGKTKRASSTKAVKLRKRVPQEPRRKEPKKGKRKNVLSRFGMGEDA